MKNKTIAFVTLVLALSVLLSACGGPALTPSGFPGLAVYEQNAYLAFGPYIYAIQLDNGQQVWRAPEEVDRNKTYYAPPVLVDSQLLVSTYGVKTNHNFLYALDPASRQVKWSFAAGDRLVGAPLVTENAIYAPSADHHLYALDLNGNLLWKFQSKGPQWAMPVADQECSCIYVTSMDHNLYALKAENGEVLWQRDLGGAIVGTPAVGADDTLYIGTFGSKMFAINHENGEILWEVPVEDWVWSGPALEDDRLYFGDLAGNFYAMSADGTILWQKEVNGPVTGTPLVTEEGIFVGTAPTDFKVEPGTIFAFDREGTALWQATVGGRLSSAPVDGGEVILVAPSDNDAMLVALNPNGSQKWAFVPAK